MVKVPGTKAGLPAIRTLIGEGINVNVTLLFSQQVYCRGRRGLYRRPRGLRRQGRRPAQSGERRQLFRQPHRHAGRRGARQAHRRRDRPGRKGAARSAEGQGGDRQRQARLSALQADLFRASAGSAWRNAARRRQRLLWASTGTKNKAYSDVLYVEELIGADTVNTMPPATMDAFRDHGKPRASLEEDVAGARGGDGRARRRRHLDRRDHRAAGRGRGAPVRRRRRPALRRGAEKAPRGARRQAQRDELQAADATRRARSRRRSRIGARAARSAGCGPATRRCGPRPTRPNGSAGSRVVDEQLKDGGASRSVRRRGQAAPASRDVLLLGMGGSSLGPEVFAQDLRRASPASRRCRCSTRPTRRRSGASKARSI